MINVSEHYQSSVQLTSDQAHHLNQVVGRFVLTNDMANRTRVQALVIEWSPDIELGSETFTFHLQGQPGWLAVPSASAIPQVQELLQNIPWHVLDYSSQLATLEVAFQNILGCLEQHGCDLSNLQSTHMLAPVTWKLRLFVQWLDAQATELVLVVQPDTLPV